MMGGVAPAEIATMTTWDYTALIWQWNDRHKSDVVEPPSEEDFYRMKAELEAEGYKLLH